MNCMKIANNFAFVCTQFCICTRCLKNSNDTEERTSNQFAAIETKANNTKCSQSMRNYPFTSHTHKYQVISKSQLLLHSSKLVISCANPHFAVKD